MNNSVTSVHVSNSTCAFITEKGEIFTALATITNAHYMVGGSGSILSKESYKLGERVVECCLLPAVSLLGVPANIINMSVFCRQGLRDKMNLCLFTLAYVDFMYVFCMFLTTLYCPAAFLSDLLLEQTLKWYIRKHVINFVYAFWYSSGTLTAIIATERCICVVWPIKSATILKAKTMGCLVWVSITVINLLCLTYVLKHNVEQETNDAGQTSMVLKDTTLFLAHKVPFQIITDNILPAISFSTFFIVFSVTLITVRKLKTAIMWRKNSSSASVDKRQTALVKMLVTVSCIYIVCNTPAVSLAIVRFLLDEFSTSGKYRNLFFLTHRAGHVLLMVNSSVNVFVYYKQSSRFRKQWHKMFRFSCFKTHPEKTSKPFSLSVFNTSIAQGSEQGTGA